MVPLDEDRISGRRRRLKNLILFTGGIKILYVVANVVLFMLISNYSDPDDSSSQLLKILVAVLIGAQLLLALLLIVGTILQVPCCLRSSFWLCLIVGFSSLGIGIFGAYHHFNALKKTTTKPIHIVIAVTYILLGVSFIAETLFFDLEAINTLYKDFKYGSSAYNDEVDVEKSSRKNEKKRKKSKKKSKSKRDAEKAFKTKYESDDEYEYRKSKKSKRRDDDEYYESRRRKRHDDDYDYDSRDEDYDSRKSHKRSDDYVKPKKKKSRKRDYDYDYVAPRKIRTEDEYSLSSDNEHYSERRRSRIQSYTECSMQQNTHTFMNAKNDGEKSILLRLAYFWCVAVAIVSVLAYGFIAYHFIKPYFDNQKTDKLFISGIAGGLAVLILIELFAWDMYMIDYLYLTISFDDYEDDD